MFIIKMKKKSGLKLFKKIFLLVIVKIKWKKIKPIYILYLIVWCLYLKCKTEELEKKDQTTSVFITVKFKPKIKHTIMVLKI